MDAALAIVPSTDPDYHVETAQFTCTKANTRGTTRANPSCRGLSDSIQDQPPVGEGAHA